MKKSVISALCALLTLLFIFAGCSGDDTAPKTDTTAAATSAAEPVTEHIPTKEEMLGFTPVDHQEYEFRMLIPSSQTIEHVASEETGEMINDTIYRRNLDVERYFNIKLNIKDVPGDWAAREAFTKEFTQLVMSGDKNYDMVVGIIGAACIGLSSQFCLNIGEMKSVDLDQLWFVADQFDTLQINNKLFCALGDMNLSLYGEVHGIFFNQQLILDNGLDDPYALVNNGEWTLDKMIEMAASAGRELDGVDGVSETGDVLGLASLQTPSRAFGVSCGLNLIERDADGMPMFADGISEKHADFYTKLSAALSGGYSVKSKSTANMQNALTEDRLLLLPGYVKWITLDKLRNMSGDYGIIPYPKYDKDQSAYISQIATAATFTAFPINVSDPELSGQVMTYMAYLGANGVTAAYYDTYISERLSKSVNMMMMLRLIRETAAINLTTIYSSKFSPILLTLFEISPSYDYGSNIASVYKTNCKVWSRTLQDSVLPMFE